MTRRFSGDELVIATHNEGKVREFREIFRPLGFRVSYAADYGLESPEETGTTFSENATLKAVFVALKTGKPALADDSGVEIAALGGAPGVYSADWAETVKNGPRDFKMAMRKVYDAMGGDTGFASADKSAAFHCHLALAWPDGHVESVEGIAPGIIVWPPRGDKGHGYDPMFQPQGRVITWGEMDESEKNKGSHRARAVGMIQKKCF